MNTTILLTRYAELMNRYGPDSEEAAAFRERHREDAEFDELAEVARLLKKALAGR